MKRVMRYLVSICMFAALVSLLTGSILADNKSAQQGGSIYNGGTMIMTGGKVYGGTASLGGNIYNAGTLKISSGAEVLDGFALQDGGNIYNAAGSSFLNYGKVYYTVLDGTGIFGDVAHVSCTCGKNAQPHMTGCIGADFVTWTKWTSADSLPTSTGYYYLDADVKLSSVQYINSSANIHIDLNGNDIIYTDASARAFHMIAKDTNVTVSISDSHDCGVINLGTAETFGALALMNETGSGSKTLNIYGGTIDGSKLTGTNGGAVIRNINQTIHIYGGTVIGAASSTKDGGAIYSGGSLNMYGGVIRDGVAANGGNLYIAGGTFTMTGGKIMNGSAATYGDNVYVDTANAEMTVAVTGESGFYCTASNNNGIYPSVNIACECGMDDHIDGCSGIRSCRGFDFGIPEFDHSVADLDYITVESVDAQYQTGKVDSYNMVSALAPQFEIGGITHPDDNSGMFYRLDYANQSTYSAQNASLANKTSGVSVRFATNVTKMRLYIKVKDAPETFSDHLNGKFICGVDVYVGSGTNRAYVGATGQHMTSSTEIIELISLPAGFKEVQINLPLYAGVESIEIGLPDGGKIAAPADRAYGDIVFYGSSITQGLSAVRPGTSYTNILGLALNANTRNLGFAASALGEQSVAQYIASLENISAFVMDYDHNSPSADELAATHYAFYKTVREAHPDIPIIMMSRPIFTQEVPQNLQNRVDIILETYNKAVAEGDTNVYFINGDDYFPDDYPDLYTDDMTHPNTLGMYCMAKTVYPVLKAVLDGEEVPEVKPDTSYDFGTPESSKQDLSGLNYISVSNISSTYREGTENGFDMISVLAPQFTIAGCEHPNDNDGRFYRLDRSNMAAYSQQNRSLAANTSGINIRFCTDATEIYIDLEAYNVKLPLSPHVSGRGTYGIDVYVGTGTDRVLYAVASGSDTKPVVTGSDGLSVIPITKLITLPAGYKEVQINLPLYSGARNVRVGFPSGATIASPTARDHSEIVVYGPSIAQGCSASRPGLSYSNILSLALNTDVRNLGFSNSALGEQVIAEYIASLDNISAFIMDYDHNNTTEGLRATHYDFYKTVRQAHPDIPIIMMSRPVYLTDPADYQKERIDIIKATYDKAVADGDTNVYFISGDDFFNDDYPDLYTVDSVHPNDLGMYYIAKTVYPLLKQVLEAN